MTDRMIIKSNVIRERGRRCEVCEEYGTPDYHEIINRARTRKGSKARDLSFDPRICSLLCRKCHDRADTPEMRQKLLTLNAQRYGEQEVIKALDAVRGAMRGDHRVYYKSKEYHREVSLAE